MVGRIGLVSLLLVYSYQDGFALLQTYGSHKPSLGYEDSFPWLRSEHSHTSMYLVTPYGSTVILYTGCPTLSLMSGADEDEFRYYLLKAGITHVMEMPAQFLFIRSPLYQAPEIQWAHISRWMRECPNSFSLVKAFPADHIYIYQVHVEPGLARAYVDYQRAEEMVQQQHFNQALSYLDQVLHEDPLFPKALNAYGATCLLMGKNKQLAEMRLRQAIHLRPQYATAWFNLSILLRQKGDEQGAAEAFAQVQHVHSLE